MLVDFLDLGEARLADPQRHRMDADSATSSCAWACVVDQITIVMFAVITTVALMVNIFSIGYMKGEPR